MTVKQRSSGIPSVSRREIVIAVLLLSAGVLVLAAFVLLIRQTRDNHRLLIEYEVSRLASLLAELHAEGRYPEPQELDPNLRGYGVYRADGEALERKGSAPPTAEITEHEHEAGEYETLFLRHVVGGTPVIRHSRPIGIARMPHHSPHRPEENRLPRGMIRGRSAERMQDRFRSAPLIEPATLWLEYDVGAYLAGTRVVESVLFGAGGLLIALLAATAVLGKRLAKYRTKQQQQQRLVELGQAARTLTHEIKNPLGALQIQQALLSRSLGADHGSSLAIVQRELQRINELVDRVGDFLRKPAGEPELLELGQTVEELNRSLGFTVRLKPAGEKLWIRFDPVRFRSVYENLLRNAAESMAGHAGEPQPIETEIIPGRRGAGWKLPGRGPGAPAVGDGGGSVHRQARLVVSDRGAGIPAEARKRVFDPFFTTKDNGTGVGLAITRSFVEAAGGSIRIEARGGGGTRVTVTLPAVSAEGHWGRKIDHSAG